MNPFSNDDRRKLDELYAWMQARKQQQISYPLDDVSRRTLGTVTFSGAGSTSLTQNYTDPQGGSISAPKAYARTIILVINGVQYEVPSLI